MDHARNPPRYQPRYHNPDTSAATEIQADSASVPVHGPSVRIGKIRYLDKVRPPSLKPLSSRLIICDCQDCFVLLPCFRSFGNRCIQISPEDNHACVVCLNLEQQDRVSIGHSWELWNPAQPMESRAVFCIMVPICTIVGS